jgi:hypothetical protein
MRQVVRDLGEVFALGFGFLEVEADEQAAALAQDLADGLHQVSASAEAIDAPADLADEHAAVISALNRIAADYDSYARSGGEARVAFDLQENATEDLSRAFAAIQTKGYDLNWK